MNEELITSVANILEEWNPLGEKASSVSDLNGYHTEAIDILSSSRILKHPIKKAVATVLSQAFDLNLRVVCLLPRYQGTLGRGTARGPHPRGFGPSRPLVIPPTGGNFTWLL